jgi:hypothetical protein
MTASSADPEPLLVGDDKHDERIRAFFSFVDSQQSRYIDQLGIAVA